MAETIAAALANARKVLHAAGIENASLDARLLLQEATGLSHAGLISAQMDAITPEHAARLAGLLARRAAREPVSRILGRREFRGLDFALSRDTLDPRPDTETLVEAVLAVAGPRARILDLGTGTGAVLLSLLHALPEASGLATDISEDALATARANAGALGLAGRAQFRLSDWFARVEGEFDVICSNPPYIPQADIAGLSPEVRLHDPFTALSGGPDGLAAYRRITAGAGAHLKAGGWLFFEIGQGQAADLGALLADAQFGRITQRRDLSGIVRVVGGQKA